MPSRTHNLTTFVLVCIVSMGFVSSGLPADSATTLPLTKVTCAMDVPKSIRVANDLYDCPSYGLRVTTDDVTVDLNGHRVDGSATNGGVIVASGILRTHVRNGVVDDFSTAISIGSGSVSHVRTFNNAVGIYVFDGRGAISRNTVEGNSAAGIVLLDSGRMTHNVVTGNGAGGSSAAVTLDCLAACTVSDNVISGNANDGLSVLTEYFAPSTSAHADVTGNTVRDNGKNGIFVNGQAVVNPGTSFVGSNTVTSNGATGVEVNGGDGNVISGNVVAHNAAFGVNVEGGAMHQRVKGNSVSSNNFTGIELAGGSDNAVVDNVSNGNFDNGIELYNGGPYTVRGNTATRNGFDNGADDNIGLGLKNTSASGVSGANNHASGNDDPQQCSLGVGCV